MWCVAELNEEYIARMEDVLKIYEKPLSEREPVVCVDEKPVVLHADVRPPRPMRPGRIARRDCEYERCGTANVFCGVQPKAWRHSPPTTSGRSGAIAPWSIAFVSAAMGGGATTCPSPSMVWNPASSCSASASSTPRSGQRSRGREPGEPGFGDDNAMCRSASLPVAAAASAAPGGDEQRSERT